MKLERSAKIKQKVGLKVERGLGQLLEPHLQRIGTAFCMDLMTEHFTGSTWPLKDYGGMTSATGRAMCWSCGTVNGRVHSALQPPNIERIDNSFHYSQSAFSIAFHHEELQFCLMSKHPLITTRTNNLLSPALLTGMGGIPIISRPATATLHSDVSPCPHSHKQPPRSRCPRWASTT